MKKNTGKQHHKSKAELLNDLKNNKEFQTKMSFTRDVFYPAVCNASTSIDDAQILLSGFNTTIMQQFLALMKEKKLSDLDLKDKLDKDNPKYAESVALIELFGYMSVFEAKDYIEGMRDEIQLFVNEELKTRSLSDLKVKWVDQL